MKKRTNTTPSEPVAKRVELNSSQENAPVTKSTFDSIRAMFGATKADTAELNRSMSNLSVASAASAATNVSTRSNYEEADALNGNRRGMYRNVMEIDVLTFDDKPYMTNMTEYEVYKNILRGALGLKRSQINSVQLGWQGHPYIQVRLKMDVRINDFSGRQEYEHSIMNTDGEVSTHTVMFEVRGYTPEAASGKDGKDNWIRWVKIEQTGLDADRARLTELLTKFGTVLTNITEVTIQFKDEIVGSDDDPDEQITLGTGKFEVQMQIETHIPQYIPAFGRKLKFHYKGILKQCTNCYASGHYKANCKDKKVEWIEYVCWFRENYPEIGPELLGRWNTLAGIHIRKKTFSENQNQKVANDDQGKPETEKTAEVPPATTPEKKTIKRGRKQTKNTQPPESTTQPTMGAAANTRSRK